MSDLTEFHGLTKEEWAAELEDYHDELRRTVDGFTGYGSGSIIEKTGWDAWAQYFLDGYSPKDALEEDLSYWDE